MSRTARVSTPRQLAMLIGVAVILGGGIFALSIRPSHAAESCAGLDTALQNNLNFIAGQQANPDAQSAARIANRQAVVNLIQQRRAAAGCTNNVSAQQPAANNQQGSGENCQGLDTALQNNLNFIAGQKANPDAQSAARIANREAVVANIQARRKAAGCKGNGGANAGNGNKGNGAKGNGAKGNGANGNGNNGNGNNGNGKGNGGNANGGNANAGNNGNDNGNAGGKGKVVCAGDTVTTNGQGGNPGVASGTFPIGTLLKITNLDNNQSITAPVTDVSGSCALLNTAAFDKIHEAGKQLIRRAKIEKVG